MLGAVTGSGHDDDGDVLPLAQTPGRFKAVLTAHWNVDNGDIPYAVARFHGLRRACTLHRWVMLVHEMDSSPSVWPDGLVDEQYGSFDAIWLLDIALAALAVALNLAIRERAARYERYTGSQENTSCERSSG